MADDPTVDDRRRAALQRSVAMLTSHRAGETDVFRRILREACDEDPRWTMLALIRLTESMIDELSLAIGTTPDEVMARLGVGFAAGGTDDQEGPA